jgi:hypothetical protein
MGQLGVAVQARRRSGDGSIVGFTEANCRHVADQDRVNAVYNLDWDIGTPLGYGRECQAVSSF